MVRLLFAVSCLVLCTISAGAQGSDPTLELMKELTTADGPSGFEEPVRQIFIRELKRLGAEVSTDGLGSVIGVVRGASACPRIMVDAHLDELGLIVRAITPDGFIKFQTLGGWLDANLLNQRWTIHTRKGPVPAVSGTQDAHVTTNDELKPMLERRNIFLDVGARSRAEAEALGIQIGDPVAPASPFTVMANGRYAAKAWDDRVGLVLTIKALERLKQSGAVVPGTLYLTGTVQEEVGLRGAVTATNLVKPDLGIALEVGIAADFPGTGPDRAEERLGDGPAVFAFDASMLPNLKLLDFFRQVAAEKKIPLQTDVVSGYGEDGAVMQKFEGGRPAINFTVPTRYTHSHTGIIDRADFDHAVDLLVAVLTRLDARTVSEISRF